MNVHFRMNVNVHLSIRLVSKCPLPFGLPKDLKGATTYKHAVALKFSVEINK
jgi:hypothetical protein